MSVLTDLGTYLQAEGHGTLATDLFLGGLPQDAPNITTQDAVTALVEIPGYPVKKVHDVVGVSWEEPVVQILTRGAPYDYEGARAWAQNIFLSMAEIQNQILSGTFYLWALPEHSVYKLRDDDFARPIMSCQFRIGKSA
jgi:Bacteriophage minor capsid protein